MTFNYFHVHQNLYRTAKLKTVTLPQKSVVEDRTRSGDICLVGTRNGIQPYKILQKLSFRI